MHTDDGVTGVAEAPPRPYTYGETQASIIAVVDGLVAPQQAGLSRLERGIAHARMDRTVGNPAAKAAGDVAIWDALATPSTSPSPACWADTPNRMRVSHMVGFASDAAMVAEAERVRDTYGIRTFKVKAGRRPVDLDVGAVRALRTALGPDVELYVDGNRGWTPLEAPRALHAMADLGLGLSEELCPADEVLGRRLAPLAPGPPAPDRQRPGPPPGHHHPAVLPRRPVARQRRGRGGQARAGPRFAGHRRGHPPGRVRLRPRTRPGHRSRLKRPPPGRADRPARPGPAH